LFGINGLVDEDKAFHLHRLRYLISPGSAVLNVIDAFESGLDTALAINTFFYATLIYGASSALLRVWNRDAREEPYTRQG